MVKTNKLLLALSLVILSALLPNCNRDHDMDCSYVACTEEFRSVMIIIKSSTDSTPVVLTDYKVYRVSDNQDITVSDSDLSDNNGYYTLVNDSRLGILKNKNIEIEFQGFLNGVLVIRERFRVGGDCCHVSLMAGDTIIYI